LRRPVRSRFPTIEGSWQPFFQVDCLGKLKGWIYSINAPEIGSLNTVSNHVQYCSKIVIEPVTHTVIEQKDISLTLSSRTVLHSHFHRPFPSKWKTNTTPRGGMETRVLVRALHRFISQRLLRSRKREDRRASTPHQRSHHSHWLSMSCLLPKAELRCGCSCRQTAPCGWSLPAQLSS
jgi:hypothetical protein